MLVLWTVQNLSYMYARLAIYFGKWFTGMTIDIFGQQLWTLDIDL